MLSLRTLVLALAISAVASPSLVDARTETDEFEDGLFNLFHHGSKVQAPAAGGGGGGLFGGIQDLIRKFQQAVSNGGKGFDLRGLLQKILAWKQANGNQPNNKLEAFIRKIEAFFGAKIQDLINKFLRPKGNGGNGGNDGVNAAALAAHSTPNDCWLQIDGQLYDATDYAPRHPLGAGKINAYCGRDATSAYHRVIFVHPRTPSKLRPVSADPAPGPSPIDNNPDPTPLPTTPPTVPPPPPSNPNNPPPSGPKIFDAAALSAYPNCAIVVDGQVYGLGSWASKHPAGAALITGQCGKDASGVFQSSHGNPAKDLAKIQQFVIGQYGNALINEADEEEEEASIEASIDSADSDEVEEVEEPEQEEVLEEEEQVEEPVPEFEGEREELEQVRRRVEKLLRGLRYH